jgi:hypothetical protein
LLQRFQGFNLKTSDFQKPSVIILIFANLLPIFGVLFLDWKVFPILFLYWVENVIVGFFNVLKMAFASPANGNSNAAKTSAILFFCVHYGLFTFVHGIFVIIVFGGADQGDMGNPDFPPIISSLGNYGILWGIITLIVSHGLSFGINYIGKGEYKEAKLNGLMSQPYSRVVVLHLIIIFGGFLITFLGSPEAGLIVLIVVKMGIDILAHLRQHAGDSASVIKSGINGR